MDPVPIEGVLLHIRDALATDGRVGELGLDVVDEGGVIVVRGAVSTATRRSAVCELVAEVLHEFAVEASVRDETHVPDASAPSALSGATVTDSVAQIRIAAVGDIHLGVDCDGRLAAGLVGIEDAADVLLLAGDLTKCGTADEARVVVSELRGVPVPIVAVLGNHDHHDDRPEAIVGILAEAGIRVLEGHTAELELPAGRLGVAGVKGFGGGFAGANAAAFGEPEMKAFVNHTYAVSERLATALARLSDSDCDARVALLHYSPVPDTLAGERLELYPFLGSGLLAEAIDRWPVDLVLHGHAHSGSDEGRTPGGTPVRNVAMPLIGAAYRVFELAVPAHLAEAGRS